jgi:hypothetical protein
VAKDLIIKAIIKKGDENQFKFVNLRWYSILL